MKKFKIESKFEPAGDQGQAIKGLVDGFNNGLNPQTLKGVTGSGKTYTMAKVIEKMQVPALVISHNKTLAAQLYREFQSFFPENAVEYFVSYYDYYQPEAYVPSRDLYIEKDSSINEEIDRMRLATTMSLMERKDVIVVSSVSCIYGLGNPKSFKEMSLRIEVDQLFDVSKLSRNLVSLQFTRNDAILKRGGFRIKGDVVEIYPAYLKEAYRLELEWDTLVRIRKIDPLTGSTIAELDTIVIYPAKHFVMPEDQLKSSIGVISKELSDRYAELMDLGKIVEAQRLKTRTEYDIEMMEEMGYCSGIENYSGPLSGRTTGERPSVLIDYFPDDFLTLIDESHVTLSQIGAMYEGDKSRKTNLVNHGFRLPSALDNRPLFYAEFEELVDKLLYISATPRKQEIDKSENMVEQVIRPTGLLDPQIDVRSTEGQIENLYGEIQKRLKRNERVLITTLTKKMSEDLTDYYTGLGLKIRYLHSEIETIERVEILRDLRLGIIDVLVGINLLREGLDLPEVSLVAILDADKIGFLRSATALIQTIGRVARNVNGTVIMYADKYSSAMEEALEETTKRRDKQIAYNQEHGITPASIKKSVEEMLVRKKEDTKRSETVNLDIIKNGYNILIPGARKKLLKKLDSVMLEHAKNMEFEEAALVRDEIIRIKDEFSL
ncbi:MAG: excinuclease ABC subunit UvrB [Spirochaetia bacterium]|jgi:excinuclease ABC subunit B|nr:excinuclease ABC subunit UvrB [Spirochaetia bacterium]